MNLKSVDNPNDGASVPQAGDAAFIQWFRNAAPYINAFRNRTFVIAFGGEVICDAQFPALVHDVVLLNSLGVRLVLVHGARPQIEQRLNERGAAMRYVNDLRITDDAALVCVKDAAGSVRVEIEALLSMGMANSPTAGAHIRVASGNFVVARPLGVREGVDYQHTGEVRRIDHANIQRQLEDGALVLLSPLGYSPTGEVFNLSAEDVATATAIALGADKLIYILDVDGVADTTGGLIRQLTLVEAQARLKELSADAIAKPLASAVKVCQHGVRRAHMINRHVDGALLQELFTRDGVGTLVSSDVYEGIRLAHIDDVGGILELIEPLESQGILVRRSRERLEMEIDHFTVLERDGAVIACFGLYPFTDHGLAELAGLAVHPDYQKRGKGEALLNHAERAAQQQGIQKLFVLTTRAQDWFRQHGYHQQALDALPVERQAMVNYQRNSKVFVKVIG
ncbi:MAG TPA: amino-acid N-acetyltransferase [Acidiferrobacteraceae bacterium]|nr:amino-acid N-acetyltransferase [Acidiferrobacteraceae bacterium]